MNRGDNSSGYRCGDGMNGNHGVSVAMECRGAPMEQDKPRVDRASARVLLKRTPDERGTEICAR